MSAVRLASFEEALGLAGSRFNPQAGPEKHTNINTSVRKHPVSRGGSRSVLHLSVSNVYTPHQNPTQRLRTLGLSNTGAGQVENAAYRKKRYI